MSFLKFFFHFLFIFFICVFKNLNFLVGAVGKLNCWIADWFKLSIRNIGCQHFWTLLSRFELLNWIDCIFMTSEEVLGVLEIDLILKRLLRPSYLHFKPIVVQVCLCFDSWIDHLSFLGRINRTLYEIGILHWDLRWIFNDIRFSYYGWVILNQYRWVWLLNSFLLFLILHLRRRNGSTAWDWRSFFWITIILIILLLWRNHYVVFR